MGWSGFALAVSGAVAASPPDLLPGVSLSAAGIALVAWGVNQEKVKSQGKRLDVLESDRVTRSEFAGMRDDVKEIRGMLERRQLKRD